MDDYLSQIELRKQLTFFEANILIENVNQKTTQGSLIARLDLLSQNTRDERLLTELNSLLSKVKDLTPQDFARLKQDTLRSNVIFPPDYTL